jgi:hypothetical protein
MDATTDTDRQSIDTSKDRQTDEQTDKWIHVK